MSFDKKDLGRVFEIGQYATQFVSGRASGQFTITHVEHSLDDPDQVLIHAQFQPPTPASYSHVQQSAAEVMAEEVLKTIDIVAECRRPQSVESLRTLVRVFYGHEGNGCGGCLHIVLDDGNIDDDDIDFCIDKALAAHDEEAVAIGRQLRAMTYRQRQRVYDGSGPDALETMKEALDHAR